MAGGALGRRVPTDFEHVSKYPLSALVAAPAVAVEKLFPLPRFRAWYDQGHEGACVGFSCSWAMSIMHRRKFDARWLYHEAQLVDEYADTPPAEGTSVRAGFDVLRLRGAMLVRGQRDTGVAAWGGVRANHWGTSADDVRAGIAAGFPVVLGISWYSAFDTPVRKGNEWWIGDGASLGSVRGQHAICVTGASDKRQAAALTNSWGSVYPARVWLPYSVIDRLLAEQGEAGIPDAA